MKKRLMIFTTMGLLAIAAFAFGSDKDRTPSCPWEGTPECPKLGCPLADTPQCPFEKDETAMVLPACCKSKSKRVRATKPFSCEHLTLDASKFN